MAEWDVVEKQLCGRGLPPKSFELVPSLVLAFEADDIARLASPEAIDFILARTASAQGCCCSSLSSKRGRRG
jgi:hypothetical protein